MWNTCYILCFKKLTITVKSRTPSSLILTRSMENKQQGFMKKVAGMRMQVACFMKETKTLMNAPKISFKLLILSNLKKSKKEDHYRKVDGTNPNNMPDSRPNMISSTTSDCICKGQT